MFIHLWWDKFCPGYHYWGGMSHFSELFLCLTYSQTFERQAGSALHSGKKLAFHWKHYKKFERRPEISVPATCISVVVVKSFPGLLWKLMFSLRLELNKAARNHWALITLTALKVACLIRSPYLLLPACKTSVSSIFRFFKKKFLN